MNYILFNTWPILVLYLGHLVDADQVPGANTTTSEVYSSSEFESIECNVSNDSRSYLTRSFRDKHTYHDCYCGCYSSKLLDAVAFAALLLAAFYFLVITRVVTVGRKRRSTRPIAFNELDSGI